MRRPLVLLAAYVAGSVPASNLVARLTRGVDLRAVGSGTVSGTALYRVAGFGPLVVGGVLDVAKGAVGPLLAGPDRPVLAAAAGGAAVAGHDWSLFLRGRGGRGISPAMGSLLVNGWEGTVVLLAGLAGGRLARRTSLGSFVAFTALVPVLVARRGRAGAWAGVGVLVPLLLKRALGNAPLPEHRSGGRALLHRLVFDEDPPEVP